MCIRDSIKYYELWNEANVGASGSHPRWDGTQTRLYQMVAPAVAVINANVPGATILTPSITNGAQAQTWMTGWLDAEIAGGVISDVYNIHYYLNNQLPENVLSGSANTLHGDLGPNYNTSGWTPLPWVVSETGYDDLTPPYGCNDGDTGTPYSTPDCVGQMVRWNLLQFSNTAALGSAPGGMGVWWYYWNSYICLLYTSRCV